MHVGQIIATGNSSDATVVECPCSAEYDVRSGPAGSGSVEYFASMRAFVDAKIHFS